MDLTFIFKVTFLILGVFGFAIFGYGLLLWIGNKLEESEKCTTFIEKYYEKYSKLSGLKKFFVNMILFTIYAPFVFYIYYIFFEFILPMFGLKWV